MSKHLTNEHAKCDFCRRSFYDNDALFKHCRETHEECFVCVRMGIRHQYHLNYEYLVSVAAQSRRSSETVG